MQLQHIQQKIHEIRGMKVLLDFDLAKLYETETRILKQAVKRNLERFPLHFMFLLTKQEHDSLRSQIVTLKNHGRGMIKEAVASIIIRSFYFNTSRSVKRFLT